MRLDRAGHGRDLKTKTNNVYSFRLYTLQHYMNNTFASADYQKLSTAAIYMSFVMIVIMAIMFAVEHWYGKDLEEE